MWGALGVAECDLHTSLLGEERLGASPVQMSSTGLSLRHVTYPEDALGSEWQVVGANDMQQSAAVGVQVTV